MPNNLLGLEYLKLFTCMEVLSGHLLFSGKDPDTMIRMYLPDSTVLPAPFVAELIRSGGHFSEELLAQLPHGTLYILRRSSTCDRRCLFSSSIRKLRRLSLTDEPLSQYRRDLRGSGKPDLWRAGSVYRIFCIYGSYENPQSDQNCHQSGTAPYSTGYTSTAACLHVPRSWIPKGLRAVLTALSEQGTLPVVTSLTRSPLDRTSLYPDQLYESVRSILQQTPTRMNFAENAGRMTTGGTTLKNFIWNRFTRFVDAISQAHTFHAHFSLLFTIGAMTFATALSLFFHQITPTGSANIALIYILTIIMISYHTDKYRYGIISGIISVFFINYMFTYPFGQFSFSTAGYPFTFAVMYFISILSSATVFRMKDQAQKINETEKLLAEAEKEKLRANLLRAVSHDLRTPLTSMIGASSSYLENETTLSSPEKRDLVSHIYEDANWLLHMVENLLSVTRITDGISNTLKETPEVAEEVLFDAVSTIRKRYPDYQIQVSVPGDFYVVPMDPLLIKQVIINLLENAYFHARSEQPVQCYLTGDDAQIQVHIRDHGNGIAPDRLKSIFDAAPSAPSSAADTKRGMGIGLSICKAIITAHNGEIHAINHADGAEFFFNLPKEAISHESEHSDSGHRR